MDGENDLNIFSQSSDSNLAFSPQSDLDQSDFLQDQSAEVSSISEIDSQTTKSSQGSDKAIKTGRKGKPKDSVWSLFKEVEETDEETTTKFQKCNNCGKRVSAKADRMRRHVEACSGSVRVGKSSGGHFEDAGSNAKTINAMTDIVESSPISHSSKIVQSQMSSFVTKTVTTKAQRLDLDSKVARFWYSSNLAFSSANLKTWKDLWSSARPGYDPPSEYMLQGPLLDSTFDILRKQMDDDLKGKEGTLIQDGWSDIHNSPVLSHTVICNGEAYLVDSIECKADKKDAKYCADKFQETMERLQLKGFKVIAGSTDNCNTMVAMRNILKERFPDLLFYGCTPHMLNRLCEEISPKQVLAKINEVSKFFRDHHLPAAKLEEHKGLKPQLPGATRWISHLECIRVFLLNRTKYIEIAQINGVCTPKIIETVNNFAIFRNATDLMTQMEEISAEILKLQSDKANVADAVHGWLKLCSSPNLRSHKSAVKSKMDVAIEPFFYVAYLLHPNYRGELLSAQQREVALDLLLDKSPAFVTLAHAFIAKDTTVFPKSSLNADVMKSSHPANWWNCLKNRENIPDDLLEFLCPMYRCPSSTASIERIFSTYGFIQTDTRNRLTQDKVMKLSFCFRALRREDEQHERKRKLISTLKAVP